MNRAGNGVGAWGSMREGWRRQLGRKWRARNRVGARGTEAYYSREPDTRGNGVRNSEGRRKTPSGTPKTGNSVGEQETGGASMQQRQETESGSTKQF